LAVAVDVEEQILPVVATFGTGGSSAHPALDVATRIKGKITRSEAGSRPGRLILIFLTIRMDDIYPISALLLFAEFSASQVIVALRRDIPAE
jgi:hypothetical protein